MIFACFYQNQTTLLDAVLPRQMGSCAAVAEVFSVACSRTAAAACVLLVHSEQTASVRSSFAEKKIKQAFLQNNIG